MGTKLSYRKSIRPKNAKRRISSGIGYRIDTNGKIIKHTYRKIENVENGQGNK